VPHLAWAGAHFSSSYLAQAQQEPLQFLADALAVCADQELHPVTALALLLSAASIPTAPTASAAPAQQKAVVPSSARHAGAAAATIQGQVGAKQAPLLAWRRLHVWMGKCVRADARGAPSGPPACMPPHGTTDPAATYAPCLRT
jgi:hypothetical protein